MKNTTDLLVKTFELQTRLFNNATEGIADADSSIKMNENTNHMAWLVGHTVSTRFMLAGLLGIQEQEPYPDLFAMGKGRDDDATYPAVNELIKAWEGISNKIIAALKERDPASLEVKSPIQVPMGNTLGETLAFFAHHEAYTIGQIGIIRRFLGHEGMKYT